MGVKGLSLMRVGTRRGAGRGWAGIAGAGSKFIHGVGEPPTSPGAGHPAGVHPASDFVGSEITQANPAPSIMSPATIALTRIVGPPGLQTLISSTTTLLPPLAQSELSPRWAVPTSYE